MLCISTMFKAISGNLFGLLFTGLLAELPTILNNFTMITYTGVVHWACEEPQSGGMAFHN